MKKQLRMLAGAVLIWAAVPIAWVLLAVLRIVARLRRRRGV